MRLSPQGRARLARWGREALNALAPPLCLACGAELQDAGGLCGDCWAEAEFIDPANCCEGCGGALDDALLTLMEAGPVFCADCAYSRLFKGRIRAAMQYDGPGRAIALKLKYADAAFAAPIMARWMLRAGAPLLAQADMIIPVPLHWRRHWRRRYNQAAELARALAKTSGVAHHPDALRRVRPTPPQEGKSAAARQTNVRGAFEARKDVARKRALLIDDVATTGATLQACADALFKEGAAHVDALVFARVGLGGGNQEDAFYDGEN